MSATTGDTVLAITRANLRRLVADRSNLFFLVVLPLLIVFALGVAIGGSAGDTRIGVVDTDPSDLSRSVTARMAELQNVELVEVGSAAGLRDDVARRTLDAGWVVETSEGHTTFRWLSSGDGQDLELRSVFGATVQEAGVHERVVALVSDDTGAAAEAAARAVSAAAAATPPTVVDVEQIGEDGDTVAGIQAVVASGQLTLFIFLTSLNGAAYLLTTRQLGVTRRMRAGPSTVSAIVAGEALARFVVALLQAAIVFFGSLFLFGVDWHAPGAVWALCVGMALVGTGGAMLLGTIGRSPQQVGALGLLLSLVLAALGGSMQPLEFFPDGLRRIAFLTPHAWMNDALWRILVDGDGLAQVWPNVLVLVGAGSALLAAASVALARTLR
ncbi:ABC transporter permease [Nocardioides sp.]|uniref:ABC transporter permease n=1 Tax=Nocardioides sp. TaxID=35761 RepID=UPI00352895A7